MVRGRCVEVLEKVSDDSSIRKNANRMTQIWITPNYSVPIGSQWKERGRYVVVYAGEKFVVGELIGTRIADLLKQSLPPLKGLTMFEL
jgi:hypothetical protein